MSSENLLIKVENLSIAFGDSEAISEISFGLERGKTLSIVGESGSGKSLTSLAVMGLLPNSAVIKSGRIYFGYKDKKDLLLLPEGDMRKMRGNRIAMIFQEPMTSLNPVHTCGKQVAEMIKLHNKISTGDAKKRVLELFEEVKLPTPDRIYHTYPHQLSGGQKQRVMIAMALSCKPDLIIADEPTTALDVTVQKRILELLKAVCEKNNTGLIFITHDLGVVAEIADDVMVMYRGRIVEAGAVQDIFARPKEPYTKALIACKPKLDGNSVRLPVVADFMNDPQFTPISAPHKVPTQHKEVLISINNLNVWFASERSWMGKPIAYVQAVQDVNLDVYRGETLGLVGESGCGKTTLGRAALKLVPIHSGNISYDGKDITSMSQSEFKPYRKKAQLIFQDPYASLNPRFTVRESILEPMIVHKLHGDDKNRIDVLEKLLDRVGLPHSALNKYPHEFSGGQRQRICIARALAVEPEFIVCDESVSALDVSVQAQVLNLLNDLKDDFGLTYIFISHDLSVVKYMSDRIVVMSRGKIEELGMADEVYRNPKSDYTRELISAIPSI